MKHKKYPNKARGGHTIQDNLRKKYYEEAWIEMANELEENSGGLVEVESAIEDFMATKGITPKK